MAQRNASSAVEDDPCGERCHHSESPGERDRNRVSDLTPADIDDPQPGAVIAGRIETDHLGEPFKLGALLALQVLEPDAPVALGALYILDDGEDVAIVRVQDETADFWVVDHFSGDGTGRRRIFSRRRWLPRASIVVA